MSTPYKKVVYHYTTMDDKGKVSFTLLEDNELYALFITEKLRENYNCNVNVYHNFDEFKTKVTEESKTDIFILDFNLTGGNGLEALKFLRGLKIEAEVILLSSQTDMQIAIDAMNAGAFEYVIKNKEAVGRLIKGIDRAVRIALLNKENLTLKIRIEKYKVYLLIAAIVLGAWISMLVFQKYI